MVQLSKPQMVFSAITILLSIAFFVLLNQLLQERNYSLIVFPAVGYGLAMFFAGLLCGKQDDEAKTRLDIGFRYHLLTFIIVNTVALIAACAFPMLRGHLLIFTLIQPVAWGLGLYVHWYYSKKGIKGYERSELFD
jgi:hypothetical protein